MLLMENYQNIMQMSTIVQQQQNQLIALQNKLATKQDSIAQKQDDSIHEMDKIAASIKVCSDNLAITNQSIITCCKSIEDIIGAKFEYLDISLNEWKVDNVKQHSAINRNVYIAWGAMGTIVLGVIALLITAYEKFALLDDVHKLLNQLIQYFHLG